MHQKIRTKAINSPGLTGDHSTQTPSYDYNTQYLAVLLFLLIFKHTCWCDSDTLTSQKVSKKGFMWKLFLLLIQNSQIPMYHRPEVKKGPESLDMNSVNTFYGEQKVCALTLPIHAD